MSDKLYLYVSHGLGLVRSEPYKKFESLSLRILTDYADEFCQEDEQGWNSTAWVEDEEGVTVATRDWQGWIYQ